jgi:hypothetical protein
VSDDSQPAASAGDAAGAWMEPLGWVALAAGGAGLVVGGVSGGLALSKRSDLKSACPNKRCAPDLHGDVDSYETLRVVSSMGFIGGAVLAAAGITLLIVAPERAARAARDGALSWTF